MKNLLLYSNENDLKMKRIEAFELFKIRISLNFALSYPNKLQLFFFYVNPPDL